MRTPTKALIHATVRRRLRLRVAERVHGWRLVEEDTRTLCDPAAETLAVCIGGLMTLLLERAVELDEDMETP